MDKRLRQVITALAIVGLLVSIYMTIYKLTNNEAMCIGNGGCPVVNASRYSEVNGIPVALIGVGGYAAILALLFLEQRPRFFQENGTMLLFGVTSQTVMTLIFILSVIRLIRQPQFQEDLNAPY